MIDDCQDARIAGRFADDDCQDTRIAGRFADDDCQDARIAGRFADDDCQDARIAGRFADDRRVMEERNARFSIARPRTILQILSRAEWNARPPKSIVKLEGPAKKIFLCGNGRRACYGQGHCTAEMQRMQDYHMITPEVTDIRYNFVITGNGVIFEGRGWGVMPHMPQLYSSVNHESLFIAFTGDFRDPKVPVEGRMLDVMEGLFKLGVDYKYIDPEYDTFDI